MVGRGTGDAVPLRAAGALIGPGGLAVRLTRIGCACGAAGGPTAFWGDDRRASTMFRPPAKKAREPRMHGQSAVDARGGAAPTGAAPAGTFCNTRPLPTLHKWQNMEMQALQGTRQEPRNTGRGTLRTQQASSWLHAVQHWSATREMCSRNATPLPPWTRVPSSVRKTLARERPRVGQ